MLICSHRSCLCPVLCFHQACAFLQLALIAVATDARFIYTLPITSTLPHSHQGCDRHLRQHGRPGHQRRQVQLEAVQGGAGGGLALRVWEVVVGGAYMNVLSTSHDSCSLQEAWVSWKLYMAAQVGALSLASASLPLTFPLLLPLPFPPFACLRVAFVCPLAGV